MVRRRHGSLTGAVEGGLPVSTFDILESDVVLARARTEGWLTVVYRRRSRWRGWHRLGVGLRWLSMTAAGGAVLLLWVAHCEGEVERRGGDGPLAVCCWNACPVVEEKSGEVRKTGKV